MSEAIEPTLADYEIQGHVFPGFGTAHSVVATFRLSEPEVAKQSLRQLIPEITTMFDALQNRSNRKEAFKNGQVPVDQNTPSLGISLSSNVLNQWGVAPDQLDWNYKNGMIKDLLTIGDPLDGNGIPSDWKFGFNESNCIDLLLVGGQSSYQSLASALHHWKEVLEEGWSLLNVDWGKRRQGDKEFFGFKDGVSQPTIRGIDSQGDTVSTRYIDPSDERSKEFAKPGQRLIWPGNFILGYAREVSGSLSPGSIFEPPSPWMKNGSYLVYRRLNQDVDKFNEAIENLHEHLSSKGENVEQQWLESRLVGRWKDGTPIIQSQDEPVSDIGNDAYRNNHFQYQFTDPEIWITDSIEEQRVIPATTFDPRGQIVPFMSHIRQVNPRLGQSEEGHEKHPQKLMLRRGIAFGMEKEEDPYAERGLLFLSYQSSIAQQFLFVQSIWANSGQAPTASGRDPIIGQDGTDSPSRNLKLTCPSGRTRECPLNGRWVIATAGAYLFTPSITGLRFITDSTAVIA